jgi:hypothetical protein
MAQYQAQICRAASERFGFWLWLQTTTGPSDSAEYGRVTPWVITSSGWPLSGNALIRRQFELNWKACMKQILLWADTETFQ